MNDANFMHMLDAVDQLMKELFGLGLLYSLLFDDVVEKLSLFHVLHHQKELLRSFDDFVELDDEGVSNQFEDVYLSENSFRVGEVVDFVFFEDFDGDVLAGGFVNGEFDLAEGSLPQSLACVSRIVPMM